MMCRSVMSMLLFMIVTSRAVIAATPGTSPSESIDPHTIMTESFDHDPGWLGVNNRSARLQAAKPVRQDFGFSPGTSHAGGDSPGEIGGYISPASEAAFYGKTIEPRNFEQTLRASGKLSVGQGKTNVLLGFFNAGTVNEWRTPNTVALRLQGRGSRFFAYVEYCTSQWRSGGDTTPFPSAADPKTGRSTQIGFRCDQSLPWSLAYDPTGNTGKGVVTATIGRAIAVCKLGNFHKADGANFNRFGLMNVVKSADAGSNVWIDDLQLNGGATETFVVDPHWDSRNNRATILSKAVRPWFDFGYSDTQFAGGKARGEFGGQIFRGDCRFPKRMACYGAPVGPLALDKPLVAFGRVAMIRGVTDSTTLFGFYNSRDSMRQNGSQRESLPESVIGIQIEGPSRDGFRFYPVARFKAGVSQHPALRDFPFIHPEGKSHEWRLVYDPRAAGGKGRITVTFDGKRNTFDLESPAESQRTSFDRFGVVTTWIDGNSQSVYWDDIGYSVTQ